MDPEARHLRELERWDARRGGGFNASWWAARGGGGRRGGGQRGRKRLVAIQGAGYSSDGVN